MISMASLLQQNAVGGCNPVRRMVFHMVVFAHFPQQTVSLEANFSHIMMCVGEIFIIRY